MLHLAEDPLMLFAFSKEFFRSKLKCKWGNSAGSEREFSFNWPTQRDIGEHQGHAVTWLWVDYRGKIRLMLRTWEYLTKAADINHRIAKGWKSCAQMAAELRLWATALQCFQSYWQVWRDFVLFLFLTFHLYSTLEKRGKETTHLPVKVLKPWPPVIRSSTLVRGSWGGLWVPLWLPDLSKPFASLRPWMRWTGRETFLRSPADN